MERHAAELEALRRLHAGELQTPTLGVNERYGRQADFCRLSGLVARSSASPKEKCRMQVSSTGDSLTEWCDDDNM
jgi:hypothetical protein